MLLRTITIMFTLIVTLSLTACDRNNTKPPRKPNVDPPSSGQVTPPQGNMLTTNEITAEYAKVVTIELNDLTISDFQPFSAEIPEDLSIDNVTILEGQANDLVANSRNIRFATPADPGKEQLLKLRVQLPEQDIIIPIIINSSLPLAADLEVDTDNDGNILENPPMLVVTGLGPNNVLRPNEVTFSVPNAPKLDPESSNVFIHVLTNGNPLVNLKPYWIYDEPNNRFVITKQKMEELLNTLPVGMMSMSVDVSDGWAFTFPYSMSVYKSSASLSGVLVDEDDQRPLTELAGKLIAIRGQNDDNPLRRVAIADSEGRFTVDDLFPGTYVLELLDPAEDYYAINAYPLYFSSTHLSVKLPVSSLKKSHSTRSKQLNQIIYDNDSWQDGTLPTNPERPDPVKARGAVPTSCETLDSTNQSATYKVTSDAQDQAVSCQIRAVIPQGTQQVGIVQSVSTYEYPEYTQSKSVYDDFWSYRINAPANVIKASGSVNDSHYSQGTITRKYCVDISKNTTNGNYLLVGRISTKNIGDDRLATTVMTVITPHCEGMLTVTSAELSNTNQAGYRVISPLRTNAVRGNSAGNYLSIPHNQAQNRWGVKLTVKFTPANIDITQVRLGMIINDTLQMAADDITGYISQREAGKLTFRNLIIPQFEGRYFDGKVSMLIELRGKSADDTLTSDIYEGVVTFDGSNRFTPLFLADEIFPDRRYGARDNGGDSWARSEAISWLTNNVYRFDDITALHAAQLSSGRSVMQHAGHSDGRQIDLRYADGNGGYTDTYGGQGNGVAISNLLNNAKREVDRGILDGPNLAHAQRWIRDNRALLESESVNADWLYAGNQWLAKALSGLFSNNQPIPEVGRWNTMPDNISFVTDHLHHWHMSVRTSQQTVD